jgi:hypothetical protein
LRFWLSLPASARRLSPVQYLVKRYPKARFHVVPEVERVRKKIMPLGDTAEALAVFRVLSPHGTCLEGVIASKEQQSVAERL